MSKLSEETNDSEPQSYVDEAKVVSSEELVKKYIGENLGELPSLTKSTKSMCEKSESKCLSFEESAHREAILETSILLEVMQWFQKKGIHKEEPESLRADYCNKNKLKIMGLEKKMVLQLNESVCMKKRRIKTVLSLFNPTITPL